MLQVSETEIKARLELDNPWWEQGFSPSGDRAEYPQRDYLAPFMGLVSDTEVRRAVVLMGPRRVGKTVMVHHAIYQLTADGVPGRDILYVSVDTPLYTGLSLEQLLKLFFQLHGNHDAERLYVFFDEVQYLKNWEMHLKTLVDSYTNVQFVATGSAAAALRLKSTESGAGRFTDFILPPLTFSEFLRFVERENELIDTTIRKFKRYRRHEYSTKNIEELNREFLRYLNFGGYPEAVFSRRIQENPARFIKSDIIDKVLLKDLPSLYGIKDIQELNSLFTAVAYNTGSEVSLEGLSQSSGVAKNTIKRYIEYLEAAFLIRRIYRIDKNATRFQRQTTFKAYLTNPSMYAASFGTVNDDADALGRLTETAIFSQWLHSGVIDNLHYARWDKGEVDIVFLAGSPPSPEWAIEVKWTDAPCEYPDRLAKILTFFDLHLPDDRVTVTSKTASETIRHKGHEIEFVPSSLYAYTVSKNILSRLTGTGGIAIVDKDDEQSQLQLLE